MKRFYVTKFKKMFPKLKPKINSLNEYLDACEILIGSFKGYISVNQHLKYFIIQMVNPKLSDEFSVDAKITESLTLLNKCLYSYSDKALRRVFGDSSSRLLFTYFYQHGQSFFNQEKNVQKNLEEYTTAIDVIYQSFNGLQLD